jgi:serine/threonine-protein kinase
MWRGVDYICQVLGALSYAHERGVVHRDVKPPNILVTTQNVAKLTDFGIASKQGDPRLTGAGTALGSLYYMSPEQVMAATPDGRSDVYSVGVTLYELVTAQRPIQGDSFFTIMQAHLERIPTPPRELSPQVPPELSHIILKSLAKDPAARFQTAAEFQQALRALQDRTAPFSGASPGWAASAPAVPAASSAPPAKVTGPLTSSSLGMPQATKTWSPELIDKLGKDLAVYVGPLARVIVNRAAKRAQTLDELYKILAAEIPSENDRRKFLSSRPVA